MDRIAVVGDDPSEAVGLLEDHGVSAWPVDAGAVSADEFDAVVALGERALLDVVHGGGDVPVLAVGAGPGYEGTPSENLAQSVAALTNGDVDVRERMTLDVTAGDASYRALSDVMLVTAAAAQISEYGVHTSDATVDEVRADAVLVATPTGSRGYNAAADGAVLAPGVPAVSVVPIAPFRIDHTDWALPLPIDLTVERDEATVELLVDDDAVGTLESGAPMHVEVGEPVELLATNESRSFFG